MKDIYYYKENFINVIDEETIKCPICGKEAGNLLKCLKKHEITSNELKEKFGHVLVTCPKAMINAASKKSRKQAIEKSKEKIEEKRKKRYDSKEWKCKICGKIFSYDDYKNGYKDFCKSKKCLSEIMAKNGKCADPKNISNGIKKSLKWQNQTRKLLNKKMSRLEFNFYEGLKYLYVVEKNKIIKTKDDHNYFVDFYLPEIDVYIEIDGKYHFDENNNYFLEDVERTKYFDEIKLNLIRIKINKKDKIIKKFLVLLEYLQKNFKGILIIEDDI